MPTKVLVFESDAAFAGELRAELAKHDCITSVVDDGNAGLQQAAAERPDLILLSIELPRMNGFSVCNKLKKDPALRDVPLIILSSESSEETFEQHKKLRTRAEDYLHKPIAFGELLARIQNFVRLGEDGPTVGDKSGVDVIVIDDDIGYASVEDVSDVGDEDDDNATTQIASRQDFLRAMQPRQRPDVDEDLEAFTDAAFGRLTGANPRAAEPAPNSKHTLVGVAPAPRGDKAGPAVVDASAAGAGSAASASGPGGAVAAAIASTLASAVAPAPAGVTNGATNGSGSVPPGARASVPPPRPTGGESIELERLRAELDRAKGRAGELERELGTAKGEIARLQSDIQRGSRSDAESQRMQREIDELKAKLANQAKASGGGVSSREFLDLREALNKKDKEILALKETVGRKERDLVESSDQKLALERQKADLDDKVLATERELADARDRIEQLSADKELAKKVGEDAKTRLERTKNELEGKLKELADLQARHTEALSAHEAALASLNRDHAHALEEAEARRGRELDEARNDAEARLATLRREADEERARALAEAARQADERLASRERDLEAERARAVDELSRDRDARLAELAAERDELVARTVRERDEAIARVERERDERVTSAERDRDERVASAERERDERVASAERDRDERVAAAERERDDRLTQLGREHEERVRELENDRDARIAALEARASRELGELRDQAADAKREAEATIARLEGERDAVREELRVLGEQKREADATNAERIEGLERRVAELSADKSRLEAELESARARITALEGDLARTQSDLGETRGKLATESARADKAFAKWEADKASLDRAKDALALVLSHIEDAEGRAL